MILLLYLTLGIVTFVNSEEFIIKSQDDCGKEFKLDTKSIFLRYRGQRIGLSSCVTRFLLDNHEDRMICVRPISLNLECGTVIEYPKHQLSCEHQRLENFEESCVDYTPGYSIVIRKERPLWQSSEHFDIFVYGKETSRSGDDDDNDDDALTIWMIFACVAPVVILICLTVFIFWRKIRQQHRQEQLKNTQIKYNVSVDSTTMQTVGNVYSDVAPSHQTLLPHSRIQQPMHSSNQCGGQQSTEGCTVHPMVTAYPAQYQPAPGTYQPVPQHGHVEVSPAVYPSVLHREDALNSPPAYENP